MLLPITTEPSEILHKVSAQIKPEQILHSSMQELITNMVETMYVKDGVGLAAPQVGINLQVCMITKDFTDTKEKDLILINPVWEKKSRFKSWDEEGCLSVPGITGKVRRYHSIKVKALDETGKEIEFVAKSFFARVIQHEVDHLNGILFIEKAKNLRETE